MKHIKGFATIFALAAFPLSAWAFGSAGHQQVGAVADRMLAGTKAAAEVKKILGGLTLQDAAVWADCAKSVTSKKRAGSDKPTLEYEANPVDFPECNVFDQPGDKALFEDFAGRNWDQCGTSVGNETCHKQYHYSNNSNLRDRYIDNDQPPPKKHDIVHAVRAIIAFFMKEPVPKPFNFKAGDEKVALMLLAHYLGDIHQPLHTTSAYLDAKGEAVDPDALGYKDENHTLGGNQLKMECESLHHFWDGIPSSMRLDRYDTFKLWQGANAVPATAGKPGEWANSWATESMIAGKAALAGLKFRMVEPKDASKRINTWTVEIPNFRAYKEAANQTKAGQLAKAGARLAQTLKTLWPDHREPPQ